MIKRLVLLIIVACLFATSVSVVIGADRAQIINQGNRTTNLTFGSGVSSSYADNVGANEDIGLRVFSSDPNEVLQGNYVCLAYAAKEEWFVLNYGTTSPSGPCEPLSGEKQHNSSHRVAFTSLSNFGFEGTAALYPGQPYAVLSSDASVSLDDKFIPLNPERDGWLVGADGGDPCLGGAGIWLANCTPDAGASLFDSYDITFEDMGAYVRVLVNASYYPAGGVVRQATIDADAIVVSVVDALGTIEDAEITSIYDPVYGPDVDESDDAVDLFYGASLGKRTIYVNGIQTAEFVPAAKAGGNQQPSQGSASGASSSGTVGGSSGGSSGGYVLGGSHKADNLVWTFAIDDPYVHEITVYVTSPLSSASLFVTKSSYDSTHPILSGYLIETDIADDLVEAVFVDFSVPEEWLLDRGLYKHDVVLLDSVDMQPVVLRADIGDSFSYAAQLRDFGRFAIAGSEERGSTLSSEIRQEITAVYPTSWFSWSLVLWVLLVIIIIFLLLYIFGEERKKPEERHSGKR